MLQTLATFSSAGARSEPPAPSSFAGIPTAPAIIPQLQVSFSSNFAIAGGPSAAAIDVWGLDGSTVVLLATIPLATTGFQKAQLIDVHLAQIALVPVFTGGTSPTMTGTVYGQPIQTSVQTAG